MTDASARQDTPDNESGGPSSESSDDAAQTEQSTEQEPGQNLPVPQWSPQQPAPAPWFLGQSGPVPPNFPPPMPFPPAQGAPSQGQAPQAGQPPQTGPSPQTGQGEQSGQEGQSGQSSEQAPGSQAPNSAQQQPGNVPANGPARKPGESPGPALGPYGSPQQPAPWLDPNRYNPQAGQRPPQYDPRSPYRPPQPPREPQQQRGEEPGKRPPLSLRTRWARGLAVGGATCTLITLLNGYRNFPDWLIGASAGLVLSLGGLWFGTFAQRDALRKSQRAPEAIASVVWSSISSLIALAIVSYSLIFFPQLRQYSDCMRSANTIAGQSVCQQEFQNSLAALP
ncbi:MAG TPA: hypothetical protein VFU65_14275 [Actinocrinis sp.]|nr:hypothetical protein [Actinocrinis sp.]